MHGPTDLQEAWDFEQLPGRKLLCGADVRTSVGDQKMVVAEAVMMWAFVDVGVEG